MPWINCLLLWFKSPGMLQHSTEWTKMFSFPWSRHYWLYNTVPLERSLALFSVFIPICDKGQRKMSKSSAPFQLKWVPNCIGAYRRNHKEETILSASLTPGFYLNQSIAWSVINPCFGNQFLFTPGGCLCVFLCVLTTQWTQSGQKRKPLWLLETTVQIGQGNHQTHCTGLNTGMWKHDSWFMKFRNEGI